MRTILMAAAAVAAIGLTAAPAGAHLLPHRPATPRHATVASLKAMNLYQHRNLAHARGAVRWLERAARHGRLRPAARSELRFHRHAIRWTEREHRGTHARIRTLTRPRAAPRPAVDGCLSSLIGHESGWNVHATNPVTGAYGLPQALPPEKMASAGPDWRDSAATQIRWMLGYIAQRYGSTCAALAHWAAYGWY